MKLGNYLTWKGLTPSEFADRINKHRSTVGRWVSGASRPQWDDMPAITKETDGHVTANDFVDDQQSSVPALPKENASAA